jgi:hypothetical protein
MLIGLQSKDKQLFCDFANNEDPIEFIKFIT